MNTISAKQYGAATVGDSVSRAEGGWAGLEDAGTTCCGHTMY
jgi:hypothetical protein